MPTTEIRLDVEALRAREFPGVREVSYLNAATMGPIPERARRAVEAYGLRRSRPHELTGDDFDGVMDRARAAAARLIGAGPDEIALGPSTSWGLNVAAHALPAEPGKVIVTTDREFPANVYAWMRQHARGLKLELVPTDARGYPDEERLLERLARGDVAIFALSAVQFANGFVADLPRFARFCAEHGIWFVVDGIQALGQIPVDVRAAGIDVLACGGHKWLCGPFGSGFVYVRRELIPAMEPFLVGWMGMPASLDLTRVLAYEYEFLPDARRFEAANQGFQDIAGFSESVELLLEAGVERIAEHQRDILEPLVDWLQGGREAMLLSDLRPDRRSGILSFRPPAADSVYRALREAGVFCGFREGAIRIAAHLYNNADDVERVVRVLERTAA